MVGMVYCEGVEMRIRNVDPEVGRMLRVIAAIRGVSLNTLTLQVLEDFARKNAVKIDPPRK